MNKKLLALIFSVCFIGESISQNLSIFNIGLCRNDSVGLVSLSDIFQLSEHPDSLAVPDISENDAASASNFEYLHLEANYRKLFLNKTKISETNFLFIYDYVSNKLVSLKVKSLKVVACLNIYGADWPYRQYDYMIGFEIDKKHINIFNKNLSNTLVSFGKENPFVQGQIKRVNWKKMESKLFPKIPINPIDTAYVKYNKGIAGNSFSYNTDSLSYFLQEFNIDSVVNFKRLLVLQTKSNKLVCDRIYYDHESAVLAPITEQFTGNLFKNSPSVIFGFEYGVFECPRITIINPTRQDVYLNCDNRH